MKVIRSRNVNEAFYEGMHLLEDSGIIKDSRGGTVAEVPFPVITVTAYPTERVLFDQKRDANPFFHLMEGLWMLAGRNDADFLNRYVSDFGKRFAESDGMIHDAYGARWRHKLGEDQLDVIIKKLQSNPNDRQCVLQMWDVRYISNVTDEGCNDLMGDWKGRPCNTHIYFRTNKLIRPEDYPDESKAYHILDMTICCRSNDAVWGAHGANAVHFSMLQEYMAAMLGYEVGTMYQLSNNYHGYLTELKRIGEAIELQCYDPYVDGDVKPMPMITDVEHWDEDLEHFMYWHDTILPDEKVGGDMLAPLSRIVRNQWFVSVAGRMALVHWQWKHNAKTAAMAGAEMIAAPDWRLACIQWIQRRQK